MPFDGERVNNRAVCLPEPYEPNNGGSVFRKALSDAISAAETHYTTVLLLKIDLRV
jgi:hypothetical protein